MRSKEVDEAMKNFENYDKLISIYRPKDVTIENPEDFDKDVETVLSYISELEKGIKRLKKKNDELHSELIDAKVDKVTKNFIHKDKIRDKIEELYNTEVDRKDFYLNENDVKRRNIDLLEELLEGE